MRLFDLHCDTIGECYLQKQSLYRNALQLDLLRGNELAQWTQCFAIWIPDELRDSAALHYFKQVHQFFLQQCAQYAEEIALCRSPKEFTDQVSHHCSALLTVEGGAVLASDLSNITYLAQCGVRMLTLTWNGTNELGDGALVQYPNGLTDFGRAAIPLLENNRIAVDISHASESLFYDVAEIAQKPLVASHSNTKALCNHPRNLTNDQICLLCQSGGLIGLNFHPLFLKQNGDAVMDDIVRHAEHILSLGGQSTLAIGSDFDGAPMPQGITGIESVRALYERFLRLGLQESLVDAIFYKNANNFFVSL